MLKSIAAVSLLLTAFLSAANSQTNSTTDTREFQVAAYTRVRTVKPSEAVVSIERQVFDLINKKRAAIGLVPLTWNDDLAAVARAHSQDMADQNFFSHRGSDGRTIADVTEGNLDVRERGLPCWGTLKGTYAMSCGG